MALFTAIDEWPEGKVGRRVVSLVPSITETLYDLGLEDEVVAITKFCVHPHKWFRQKPRIGGTKNVDVERVLALQPDLIIANREENVAEQVNVLAGKVPVWLTDIKNLEDALQMIRELGVLTGKIDRAAQLANEIATRFEVLPTLPKPLTVAYIIWKNPWMAAGGDTFIHNMLMQMGLQNAFGHLSRYPIVDVSLAGQRPPDIILLSSEPYPFKEEHLVGYQQEWPDSRLQLVDGEMFSWYGSRLLQAPDYFKRLVDEWKFGITDG